MNKVIHLRSTFKEKRRKPSWGDFLSCQSKREITSTKEKPFSLLLYFRELKSIILNYEFDRIVKGLSYCLNWLSASHMLSLSSHLILCMCTNMCVKNEFSYIYDYSLSYGLNVCVSLKFLCWNPNPLCDDIRRWGLQEVIRLWGWGSHEWN